MAVPLAGRLRLGEGLTARWDASRRCDIVHAHEWGGVFADVVTMNHFRQLRQGLRIAVEPHGGHVWSQLGEMNRPMDVGALRIDNHERLTNALNDIEISPTSYMLSYLKQRGWSLPNDTIVIPNVVPDAEKHAATATVQKKVPHCLPNICKTQKDCRVTRTATCTRSCETD